MVFRGWSGKCSSLKSKTLSRLFLLGSVDYLNKHGADQTVEDLLRTRRGHSNGFEYNSCMKTVDQLSVW